MSNDLELFCTVTEFSRISGIPKKSLYNKEASGEFKLIGLVRRGRRNSFVERCIGFGDMIKLMPRFNSCYFSELLSLFSIENGTMVWKMGFKIIELVRLLNLSKQVIHGRINDGHVKQHLLRRKYRGFDEKLILAKDLKKIRSEPFNLRERILELFMEKESK